MNPIELFYQNSTVLVTGGNGFLGSVLVEKLLRCFDVKRIFLLLRAKNNENVEQRSKLFFEKHIFETMRAENFARITFVEVDYEADDLRIDPMILAQIQSNVQIIFNVVASVKFTERLKSAVDINLLATKKIVELANQIKTLKSFLHISTLFVNCNRNENEEIAERIYDHRIDYHQLISISKVCGSIVDDESESKFIRSIFQAPTERFPNTYALTKHFAEKLVAHRAFWCPCGIFRPPIVISSYQDHPGYVENLNGPAAIIAGTAKGLIRCIYGDSWKHSNVIPVDFCINAMITSAWDVYECFSQRQRNFSNIPIYNYIFKRNNLSWGQLMSLVSLGFDSKWRKFSWRFSYFIIPSKCVFRILNFILHTLPSSVIDAVVGLVGRKTIYRRLYRRIYNVLMTLSFFGTRQWNFRNDNIEKLIGRTKTFKYRANNTMEFDATKIIWSEFFATYWPGIRRHLMQEQQRKTNFRASRL